MRTAARKILIARMKATARRSGQRLVTRAAFRRATGINEYQVLKHFDSYNDLLRAAGLPTYVQNLRIPDDELLRAMGEAFRAEKGIVTRLRFGKVCRYSIATYKKRWGAWTSCLRAFRQWQEANDPEFPYVEQVAAFKARGRVPGRHLPAWQARGGRQFGDPLNFRGLLHAPVNEQGVVFLFATLAAELGFLVESLTIGFPDCEAKRRTGKAWERVRIEFEYESRNFREHRHDPNGCDLVVCWEHNWPDCPLEVLELQTVVDRLTGRERLPATSARPI